MVPCPHFGIDLIKHIFLVVYESSISIMKTTLPTLKPFKTVFHYDYKVKKHI